MFWLRLMPRGSRSSCTGLCCPPAASPPARRHPPSRPPPRPPARLRAQRRQDHFNTFVSNAMFGCWPSSTHVKKCHAVAPSPARSNERADGSKEPCSWCACPPTRARCSTAACREAPTPTAKDLTCWRRAVCGKPEHRRRARLQARDLVAAPLLVLGVLVLLLVLMPDHHHLQAHPRVRLKMHRPTTHERWSIPCRLLLHT